MLDYYRKFIHEEYERRNARNAQYSVRAFAKDLGISKSSLHNLLSGKRGLAPKSLEKVFSHLNVSEKEKAEIFSLDESEEHLLSQEEFSQIYHWWYFAILSLCNVEPALACPEWISHMLGIKNNVASDALARLKKMQYIAVEGGKMVRVKKPLSTSNGISSRSLKLFHVENLERAENAIFKVDVTEREINSVTFATDKKQYEKIKKEMKKFLIKSMETAEKTVKRDRVCTMAIQLFPQTTINKKNEKEN